MKRFITLEITADEALDPKLVENKLDSLRAAVAIAAINFSRKPGGIGQLSGLACEVREKPKKN